MKKYEALLDCPKYWVAKMFNEEDVLIDTASKSFSGCVSLLSMQHDLTYGDDAVEIVLIQLQVVQGTDLVGIDRK